MGLFDKVMDFIMPALLWLMLLLLGVMLVGLGVSSYMAIFGDKPKHIMLDVGKWECSRTETHTFTQTILVDKVIIPQVITQTECVEYKLKGAH